MMRTPPPQTPPPLGAVPQLQQTGIDVQHAQRPPAMTDDLPSATKLVARAHAPDIEPSPPQAPKNKKKPIKRSKKYTMAKLPDDWREKMWAAAAAPGKGRAKNGKSPKLRQALAVLWATGCRPAEIELGVTVQMLNDKLVLKIIGAKVGEVKVQPLGKKIAGNMTTAQRGIESRALAIDPEYSDATKYLRDSLVASGQLLIRVQYDADGLRSKIGALGKAVIGSRRAQVIDGQRLAVTISPYSFRHAMGCDIKSCDSLSDEQRSAIMGHLSMSSLEKYGRRQHGGGGIRPVIGVHPSVQPHGQRSHGPVLTEGGPTDSARPVG